MLSVTRKYLINSKNVDKSAYVWNTFAAMLNSFQTTLILLIITRMGNDYDGGVFTIAYAIGNLMMTIGKYGMRNFQATDVNEKYSYKEYIISRYISSIIMIISSTAYILVCIFVNDYPTDKCIVVISVCAVKFVEAVEDILHGRMQQKGRLDVAGKILGIRLFIYIVVYIGMYIVTGDLVLTSVVAFVITTLLAIIFNTSVYKEFSTKENKYETSNVKKLMITCFPLAACTFLIMYIANAPKYSIDAVLDEKTQTCFNIIFMPVFVISLLSNFIFQPMLFKVASVWQEKKTHEFKKIIVRQTFIILGLTIIIALGGFLLGIPVLSAVFSVNLKSYRTELVILILGGGMLALINFENMIITTIRYQRFLIWGYLIVAVISYVFGNRVVRNYGVLGISTFYSILVTLLAIGFFILMRWSVVRIAKKDLKEE